MAHAQHHGALGVGLLVGGVMHPSETQAEDTNPTTTLGTSGYDGTPSVATLGCSAPVRASHAQILDASTGEVDGATVTLDPGESPDMVLWFARPEGLPPQDVLYMEGDETFQAGASYFAAGVGSRPRVRMVR